MLRGIKPQVTRAAIDTILHRLKERHIAVLLCGMRAAPNLGTDYAAAFESIYPELAAKYGILLYPFFLDGVAGRSGPFDSGTACIQTPRASRSWLPLSCQRWKQLIGAGSRPPFIVRVACGAPIPACCSLLRFVESFPDHGPQVSCPVCLQVLKSRGT